MIDGFLAFLCQLSNGPLVFVRFRFKIKVIGLLSYQDFLTN